MKPILIGILLTSIGLIGWVCSIVFNVLTLGAFREVSYVFGALAIAGLPLGLLYALARKIFKKR